MRTGSAPLALLLVSAAAAAQLAQASPLAFDVHQPAPAVRLVAKTAPAWIGLRRNTAAAPPDGLYPLRVLWDQSRVSKPSAFDMEAFQKAVATVEVLLRTKAEPTPWRLTGTIENIACDPEPTASTVELVVPELVTGALKIYLYTHDSPDLCNPGIMAYTSLCAYEMASTSSGAEVIFPTVSLINICPSSKGSSLHPDSSPALRYRVFLHELIHSLGFGNPLFMTPLLLQPPGASPDPGLTLTAAPAVVAYARFHYGCDYIQGVPLVRGHWDPFFVGRDEIMTPCVSDQAILTPYTLAALASLGPYNVSLPSGEKGEAVAVVRRAFYGMGCKCYIRQGQCGVAGAGDITDASVCEHMCIHPGEAIAYPVVSQTGKWDYEVLSGVSTVWGGHQTLLPTPHGSITTTTNREQPSPEAEGPEVSLQGIHSHYWRHHHADHFWTSGAISRHGRGCLLTGWWSALLVLTTSASCFS